MNAWVYVRTEPQLWTVGFYAPDGKWNTDSDYNDRQQAADRCAVLNGGAPAAEVAALREALEAVIECNDNFLGYVDKGKVRVQWTNLDGIAAPWTTANSDRLREAMKQARAALAKGGEK